MKNNSDREVKNAECKFKSLTLKDLETLYHWFQSSHVKKWYAKDKDFSKEDIELKYRNRIEGKEAVPSFLVYVDHHPIGFIQYYSLNDFFPEGIINYDHELFNPFSPSDIAGIDLFIGDEKYLGKGYGAKILNSFLKKIVFPQFKIALVDPNIKNVKAIKMYERVGFKRFSMDESAQHQETIQLMILKRVANEYI